VRLYNSTTRRESFYVHEYRLRLNRVFEPCQHFYTPLPSPPFPPPVLQSHLRPAISTSLPQLFLLTAPPGVSDCRSIRCKSSREGDFTIFTDSAQLSLICYITYKQFHVLYNFAISAFPILFLIPNSLFRTLKANYVSQI
jgi:hypothetical protein